jgi:hypothetical protein
MMVGLLFSVYEIRTIRRWKQCFFLGGNLAIFKKEKRKKRETYDLKGFFLPFFGIK